MLLRVLMLGDIVGRPGRQAVLQQLDTLRQRYAPNLILANAENSASGSGLTPEHYQKLRAAGVDGITLGDHAFRRGQIIPTLQQQADIIRPYNLPAGAAGKGLMCLRPRQDDLPPVYVITVLGQLFINPVPNDPFAAVDQAIQSIPQTDPIVIVEVHAEATSEKKALGWYLNGRVSAVVGTHTHVATADAAILSAQPRQGPAAAALSQSIQDATHQYTTPGGTAYITDIGMCGPAESIIGRRIDRVLYHMTTAMPTPFDVAEGDPRVSGVCIDIDTRTGRATAIEHFEVKANPNAPPFTAR